MNTAIIAKIRGLFNSGNKYTAKQLNALCGFNDSRKVISVLRSEGMDIRDLRLENNCKLYWLQVDINQLKLEL
ncbi:MAG: hypothetical protein KA206_01010 [Paludibacter sp.]|nr:hypothetical protein [Paludibacter sp.]